MARKKIEPITSLGNEDKLTVQKSLPLFALWRSELTLAEFKILDTYLSRIDSHKPEKRAVMFEKGELEKLLGVQKINNKELEERLKHLMGNVVKIPDRDNKKGFRLITLFEEAVAEQDNYGLWQVKMECTQKAMKYIFNIENLGYLRYKLRCITSITSRYTYIMFIYLEANRFRKSWEVQLEELKKILACDKEELYKEFKYFNRDILKRVQAEMHEKTECRYNYEPIKKGRSVVAVRLTVETLPKASLENIDPNQFTIEDLQNENRELWVSAFEKNGVNEFSKEQIDEIREVLVTIPEYKLPEDEDSDIQFRRYRYMTQKYAVLNRVASETKIKNRFLYFMKMLKSDTNANAKQTYDPNSTSAHGYQERKYDEDFYKKLVKGTKDQINYDDLA